VLNGFNGVIMAYGQTGSGKTHTIFGSKGELNMAPDDGVNSRSITRLDEKKPQGQKF